MAYLQELYMFEEIRRSKEQIGASLYKLEDVIFELRQSFSTNSSQQFKFLSENLRISTFYAFPSLSKRTNNEFAFQRFLKKNSRFFSISEFFFFFRFISFFLQKNKTFKGSSSIRSVFLKREFNRVHETLKLFITYWSQF